MSNIRWRIAFPFVALFVLASAVLGFLLTRPACLGDATCIWRSILFVALAAGGLALVIAWLVARQMEERVGEITDVARRVAEGDTKARVLPQRQSELGEFTRAFNQMLDRQRAEIDTLSADHLQFSTVLQHMADGVLITDRMGMVSLINPAACRLLKTTEADAIGRASAAVLRHHQLIELLQRVRDEGTEQVETMEIGPELFVQVVVTPFEQKGAPGYLLILQDLTQTRRLQTMRRDFISNLSHELRTPLASLRAVVETLQDGAVNDPPAAERFLTRAGREVDTMTQMVEELLELSQIESGQVRLRLAPCAIQDLVRVPVERLRPQIDGGELALRLQLDDSLPLVLVDAERMQQVVTNLLHNAIKFTPAGGEIAIVASPGPVPEAEVLLEIRDSGAGIPRQDLPRIFERFYKSDRARTRGQGGTGLGLAIARHIVQAHGGRIWAKSKEGKGSSFFLTMPVVSG